MDLFQAAKRFDLLTVEQFDFASNSWTGPRIKAQLKRGDQFLSIYHRPTRKRMLFTSPDQAPSSPVIRIKRTGEIFMVGALQEDAHADVHYRNIYALTKPHARATIIRKIPQGPADNPGWAVPVVVQKTWADVELRSLTEDEDKSVYHHGHVVITTPSNSPLQPHDTIVIGGLLGQEYYVLERYVDSSLVNARAVARGDERIDIVYRQHTGETYDPASGMVLQSYTNRNVTARISPVAEEELKGDIVRDSIKMMVAASFIGIRPRMNDKITYQGHDYKVVKIDHNPLEDEYYVWANY